MKIAHLILAHNNPLQLERLLEKICHQSAYVYVHLDKKSDLKDFSYIFLKYRISLVKLRVDVVWGTYSLVQATLNGFLEILKKKLPISHINLLSVQDYPLKSANEITDFLFNNSELSFLHSLSIPEEWGEALNRTQHYNFGDLKFKGRYILQEVVARMGFRKNIPAGLQLYGRSQWFTINIKAAAYIIIFLTENPKARKFFRLSFAPDEFIFQSILMSSPLRETLVNDNLRYIDFTQGELHPKTLTFKDAGSIINSGKLYARKFNLSLDSSILDFLDRYTQAKTDIEREALKRELNI